jgi:hypothetical protein
MTPYPKDPTVLDHDCTDERIGSCSTRRLPGEIDGVIDIVIVDRRIDAGVVRR